MLSLLFHTFILKLAEIRSNLKMCKQIYKWPQESSFQRKEILGLFQIQLSIYLHILTIDIYFVTEIWQYIIKCPILSFNPTWVSNLLILSSFHCPLPILPVSLLSPYLTRILWSIIVTMSIHIPFPFLILFLFFMLSRTRGFASYTGVRIYQKQKTAHLRVTHFIAPNFTF